LRDLARLLFEPEAEQIQPRRRPGARAWTATGVPAASASASSTSWVSQSGPRTLSASLASSAAFSVAYMPNTQMCAPGFARRTCAATRRPSTSAVCIGTEIATSRAAARRARAASSRGSTARSRQVGWKPARRRNATADATPCGW